MKRQPKTADEFWEIIRAMEWGKTQDYAKIAKEWYAELGKAGMKAVCNFVSGRVGELYEAVDRYEATGKSLEIGSDDGMSDLFHHVVGLGEAFFKANLKDPSLLGVRYAKGDYEESFAYCFLEPEKPRTKAQKEQAQKALLQSVNELDKVVSKLSNEFASLQGLFSRAVTLARIVEEDKKSA